MLRGKQNEFNRKNPVTVFTSNDKLLNEKLLSYGTVVHFSYFWLQIEDKIFLLSVSLLCFLFLLSAPIAVVMEVLEEASAPVQ